jgi:putative copper resistance protein D
MLLVGISIFQSTLAPAALANALNRSLRQLAKAGAIVVLATRIVWLLLASGEIGEGWTDVWNPSTVGSVLLDTDFGRVWQWRVGFAVILLVVLIFGRDDHWLAIALLAALTLGSLGFVGHAVMRVGVLGWLNRLSHVMHLLAAGFWLGSLVPLIASLRLTNDQAAGANALLALRRFSSLGQIAVATVLATGGINSWLALDAWPTGSSPYQALLLAKIAVVSIMVALALANRYVLLPRFDTVPYALRLLRWSAIGETIMGLGAVGLVRIFGTIAPT